LCIAAKKRAREEMADMFFATLDDRAIECEREPWQRLHRL
jgi:hypothetical protein